MEINVSQMRKNPGESIKIQFEEVLESLNIGKDSYIFNGPVQVDVKLTNTGRVISAEGNIKGTVELQCSRCLERFDLEIVAPFDEEYCHENDLGLIEEEGKDKDECHVYSGDKIYISADVQETVSLNLPMKPVCRESCAGICPTCGLNLNDNKCKCENEELDPRLEVLKKLLKN